MFSKKLANVLSEQTKVNAYNIELGASKQPPYGLIYSLRLIRLKTIKIYIQTNLTNSFIWASKSLADTLNLFVYKPNDSFYLYVNYQKLNNPTIKNLYPLPLIGKFLDWLGWAKSFTQLDLLNTYHWMRIKKDDK